MIYLDDAFCDHPKVVAAERSHPLAPWLYVAGLGYCRKYKTGGFIPEGVVPTLVRGYKPAMKDGLVPDLWDQCDDGYLVHDYESWYSQLDKARKERSEKARKAGIARALKQTSSSAQAQLNGAEPHDFEPAWEGT